MKRTLYIFIGLVLPLLSFAKDNTQALFEKGNADYAMSEYKEALSAYQQVLDAGFQSAALYFNMGNASYKNGDIAPALLYYEKAHRLSPGDEDINFNIRLANSKITDKIDEAPEFFLNKWWTSFISGFSVNVSAVFSVILFLSGAVVLILYFFTGSVLLKKTSFYAAAVLFLLGILTVFIAGRQADYFDGQQQAIIFSGAVNVKSGPAERLGTVFILHDGTKVNVLDRSNGWMKIRLANGNEGWIKRSAAKEI